MLDRELVLNDFPDHMPDDDCKDFVESLNRTRDMFESDESLDKDHHLLESIDRYLKKSKDGTSGQF